MLDKNRLVEVLKVHVGGFYGPIHHFEAVDDLFRQSLKHRNRRVFPIERPEPLERK